MATLKQSTAYTRMFLMVDSTDHVTGKTGLTVTLTLSKAGGAFAAAGGAVTEVSSGWYKVALNTTDTNTLGDLAYHATATNADPTDFVDQVTANILGDTLPANLTQVDGVANASHASGMVPADARDILGTAISAPATAGILDVNVKNIVNTAAAVDANNLLKVDVEDWKAQVVPAPSVTGVPKVDLTDIDGLATNGNNATLNLKQLNVVNSAGSAIVASSTGGAGSGINASGNAAGDGIKATGGASGNGLNALGGGVGSGIRGLGGLFGNGATLQTQGSDGTAGLLCNQFSGGNNTDGIKAVKNGTGCDIRGDICGTVTAATTVTNLSSGERTAIADALLDRNMASGVDTGTDTTIRTVRQALRFLRNKWCITGSTLSVFKEDDATLDHTSSLATTAGASPVTCNTPV